jgi:hypothetical protein
MSVTVPNGPHLPGETDDAWIARIAAQDVPVTLTAPAGPYAAGTEIDKRAADALGATYTQLPFTIVDEAAIPTDRTYRNAWKRNGAAVDHDMPKARNIHRDKIREARKAVLADLDGQWMRAKGRGDDAAAAVVEAKREAWRNATTDPAIGAAADVTALKAISLPAV